MSEHDWCIVDEEHRVCERCGLRLVFYRGNVYRRGWLAYDVNGVPNPTLLMGQNADGSFGGGCVPRVFHTGMVLVEYTGDPDLFPGCERIMHRIAPNDAALTKRQADVFPVCGHRPIFWELGPERVNIQGWNWCQRCRAGSGWSPQDWARIGALPWR